MIKLQPLTAPLREMARVSSAEAKSMHVISDAAANIPVVAPKRYNVRVADNTIAKYTLTDDGISIVLMQKQGDKYVPSCRNSHTF